MLENVPQGVIAGGWKYVIAAYSITFGALILYTWSLVLRERRERHERRESTGQRKESQR